MGEQTQVSEAGKPYAIWLRFVIIVAFRFPISQFNSITDI